VDLKKLKKILDSMNLRVKEVYKLMLSKTCYIGIVEDDGTEVRRNEWLSERLIEQLEGEVKPNGLESARDMVK
jgi:hypothetical protein